MKIVGLTGGIASGKSTVSQLLREAAIPVIDADRVAHDALLRGTLCYRLVVSRFGPHILDTSTLEVDRAKLGTIVFSDGAARKQLNGIMLPWIGLGLFFQVAFYFSAGAPVVVIDAPLLFETRLDAACSLNVVVSVDKETQLRRLVGRDAQGEAEARRRIAAQPLSLAQKAARADVVIDNSQGLDALRANVERCLPGITHLAPRHHLGGPQLLGLAAAYCVCRDPAAHSPRFVSAATGAILALGLVGAVDREVDRAVAGWGAVLLAASRVFAPAPLAFVVGVAALAVGRAVVAPLLRPVVIRAGDGAVEPIDGRPVVFAASFNPVHSGHVALLEAMAARHPDSTIYACVAFNAAKEYAVPPERRAALVAEACAAVPALRGRVVAAVVAQFPWRFAMRRNAKYLYRGVRTWAKDGAAEQRLAVLNSLGPILLERAAPVPTRYIEAEPEFSHISSTLVRDAAASASAGALDGLVPDCLREAVAEAYSRR